MAKLNRGDSGLVMRLKDMPGWQSLLKLAAATVNDLNARQVAGTNEFETLRSLFVREGRVSALKEFFDGIENGDSLSEDATHDSR